MSAVSPLCVMAKTSVWSSKRRVAVAQLAGVLDFDRQAGQGFDLVLAHQGRVPTGAAGGHHEPPHGAKLLRREIQAAELRRRRVEVSRPRMAFSIDSGCSKISLSM